MTWVDTTGTITLVSGYQGVTTPVGELYQDIERRGWAIDKVTWQKDGCIATAKNPHGEKQTARGHTENSALANLLMRIVWQEFIRTPPQQKVGMWQTTFAHQLEDVARAYAEAPVYDPKAAGAWKDLASDAVHRFDTLAQQLDIEVVDQPNPYPTVQEMCDDVHQNQHLFVSRLNTSHPIWSTDQVIAFRAVHDVLGHCVTGSDYGWEGENQACAALFPLLNPVAQKALFTECIGQTAYQTYYRALGPQKIAFLDEYVESAQSTENAPGHQGVHPSQSLAPIGVPAVEPAQQVLAKISDPIDPNYGWASDAVPASILSEDSTERHTDAYLWHGDPLKSEEGWENARKLHSGWADLILPDGSPDRESMKQAVINAFRAVLLSPNKALKWNVIQFQDLMSVPASVSDPNRFWDTLDTKRRAWNMVRQFPEDIHRAYYQDLQTWYRIERMRNPEMSDEQVRALVDNEFRMMWIEEEEQVLGEAKKELSAFEIENQVITRLKKRLSLLVKERMPKMDFHHDAPSYDQMKFTKRQERPVDELAKEHGRPIRHQIPRNQNYPDFFGESHPERYHPFLGTQVRAIAEVGLHVDEILDAALEDVLEYDGKGHHFRGEVLSLGIKGVGPKVASFAWLILAPLTSEIATIDTHMMDVLGYRWDTHYNPRDYFRFERELAARRDQAGYGHIPLGLFQWMMWDLKRTGPGSHQDHSGVRAINPTPWDAVKWLDPLPTAKGSAWSPPLWWAQTKDVGDQVVKEWLMSPASKIPQKDIPFGEGSRRAAVTPVTPVTRKPYYVHPETAEEIEGQPGQSLMMLLKNTLGLSTADIWRMELNDLGKR